MKKPHGRRENFRPLKHEPEDYADLQFLDIPPNPMLPIPLPDAPDDPTTETPLGDD